MFGGACSRYSLHTKSLAEVRGGVLILIWEPPSKVAAGLPPSGPGRLYRPFFLPPFTEVPERSVLGSKKDRGPVV